MLLSLLLFSGFIYIRCNKLLQNTLEDWNVVGIQIRDHIYAPIHDLHQDSPWWFDLVLIGKHQNHLHLYRVFHQEYSTVSLTYVPVMHKLAYVDEDQEKEHSYYPGSPFRVRKGDLVLYKRKKKGLGFSLEEVARSKSWPIQKF